MDGAQLFKVLSTRAALNPLRSLEARCPCVHVSAQWHSHTRYTAALDAACSELDRLLDCEATRRGVTVDDLWLAHLFAVRCGRTYIAEVSPCVMS